MGSEQLARVRTREIKTTKLLLANPPFRTPDSYGVRAGSRWAHSIPWKNDPVNQDGKPPMYTPFPFFLAYATASLEREGYKVKIIDSVASGHSYQTFYRLVKEFSPDIVVIESHEPSYPVDSNVAETLHKMGFHVAWAGMYPTAIAEKLIRMPFCDSILKGEYDLNVLDLARTGEKRIYDYKLADVNNLPPPHRGTLPMYEYNDLFGRMKPPQLQIWACYDDQTEILTNNGWKPLSELEYTDKVCTLNPETDKIEFHSPLEIQKRQYSGEMYEIKTRQIDLLVTPNHEVFYTRFDPEKYPFKLEKIKEIADKTELEFKKNGIWKGEEREYFYLPAITYPERSTTHIERKQILMDVFLEFLGYYLSEGNVQSKRTRNYLIKISQKDSRKRVKIEACLQKMGYNYHSNSEGFFISNKQLYTYLKSLGHAKKKFIPQEFKELCPRQLRILLDALMLGDGNNYKNEILSYFSSSSRLIDDFQELLLKIGYSGNKLSRPSFGYPRPKNSKRKVQSIKYRINWIRTQNTPRINYNGQKHIRTLFYEGMIYDCTVPNHVIYVRRNGKACWSGNSRGCPYRCAFCIRPPVMYLNKYRLRSVSSVLEEIRFCVNRWNFRSVYFDDDTFNIGDKRIQEICRGIREFGVEFGAMCRADTSSEETFRAMADSGCVAVKFGVECAIQSVVDEYNKQLDLEKVRWATKLCKDLGIFVHLTFIHRNQRELEANKRFIEEVQPNSYQETELRSFRGTPIESQKEA